MIGRQIRRIPAVILVVLLAILTLRAWLDAGDAPLTLDSSADGLSSISWGGRVAPDGRLAISVRYEFSDDEQRTFDIRVPPGSRYLAVNGEAISASSGVYANANVASSATVTYELPGRVTRYRDGALLRLVGINGTTINGDEGLFVCPRCYIDPVGYGDSPVYGALALPGADGVRLEFIGLRSVRSEADADEIRFVGIDEGTEGVSMIAVLPSGAVPELTVRDGTVGQALAALKDELRPSGERLTAPSRPAHGERWAAVILTIMLGLIVVWMLGRLAWSVGSRAAARAAKPLDGHLAFADVRSVRPSDLEPALAGAVVGDAVAGPASVVAATLLELARRRVIDFTGNDRRRFSVVVPADATGSTSFEQAVIDGLRLDDDPPVLVERTYPHLWGERSDEVTKRLRSKLIKAAMEAKLFRISWPALLLVPMTIAMGVVAITGTTGGIKYAWFVTIVGPLLALVTVMSSAVQLTARGRAERAHWVEYAKWLRTNQYLAEAEPWSVANHGPILSYAAALGAAPEVVRLLSPDRTKLDRNKLDRNKRDRKRKT